MALRFLEREGDKEQKLWKALEIGERSWFEENFNPKQNLDDLHRKYLWVRTSIK